MNRWLAILGTAALTSIISACATGSEDQIVGASPDRTADAATPTSSDHVDSGSNSFDDYDSSPSVVVSDDASIVTPTEDASTFSSGDDVSTSDPEDANTGSETCGVYVGPDVTANCSACGTMQTCQANGCYGGYWCNTTTNGCHAQPSGC